MNDRHPHDQLIRVRWETYVTLKRLRDDYGGTLDAVIRDALRAKHPGLDL